MKIKIDSLSFVKDPLKANDKAFRIWDLKFKVNPATVDISSEDSSMLRCLKNSIKEHENVILYNELSEIIDISNVLGNNFWTEEYFENACRFEFRNYFDFSECKLIYV